MGRQVIDEKTGVPMFWVNAIDASMVHLDDETKGTLSMLYQNNLHAGLHSFVEPLEKRFCRLEAEERLLKLTQVLGISVPLFKLTYDLYKDQGTNLKLSKYDTVADLIGFVAARLSNMKMEKRRYPMLSRVSKETFDAFLKGKKFTTETARPSDLSKDDHTLHDTFSIDGKQVASQFCDNGEVAYLIYGSDL